MASLICYKPEIRCMGTTKGEIYYWVILYPNKSLIIKRRISVIYEKDVCKVYNDLMSRIAREQLQLTRKALIKHYEKTLWGKMKEVVPIKWW